MQPLLQRGEKSITKPECVFLALGIHHAKPMRLIATWHAPLCDFFCLHYPINGKILGKKIIEHNKGVSIFCTTVSETFFILRIIERDMIKNVYWLISGFHRAFLKSITLIGRLTHSIV